MKFRLYTLLTALLPGICCISAQEAEHSLYYESPADAWEERLPVGNGRLGMMPDGNPVQEHIILNEISLWSGCETDYSNPDAAESLKEIREELFAGRNAEAQRIMYKRFVPKKERDGSTYGSYQVLGQLIIRHCGSGSEEISGYRRWLDLTEATAYAEYDAGDVSYRKTYYCSRPDDVMVVEISASRPGAISFDLELDRASKAEESVAGDGCLMFTGHLDSGSEAEGMGYSAYAKVVVRGKDASVGTVEEESPRIEVRNAARAWIIVSAATSYFDDDYNRTAYQKLEKALRKHLKNTHKRSVSAHKELYERCSLSIKSDKSRTGIATDERIAAFSKGEKDNSLAALYYNFGRYLLICSTRPGSLPPNLQGLWANTFQTPWNGDYHTNINVQMNHWIAESGNLSELHEPLADLVMRLLPSGEKSAKDFYGPQAKGWVQHMMTNVWNYTAPGEDPSWGATNTGGAWLCAHLWEHYVYSGDIRYLKRIFPALKGASEFFLSTMVREPENGWLVTAPSSSPENSFLVQDGEEWRPASICMGPTMDNQIIRELFGNTKAAAEILGCDKEFCDSLETALGSLAPHKIGREGYLMEWMEDYKEAEPQHRHISHLYGLYPGCQISPSKTPELAEAARITLNRRGDEATGWSRAWKINFWARLGDGDRALKLFRSLLSPAAYRGSSDSFCNGAGTYPNLLCAHPPFQIDGNFGGAAGIGEMLIQSNEGFINLLPALPSEWQEGQLKGCKVRGGATVDLKWQNGRPTEMNIRGGWQEGVRIRIPEGMTAYLNGRKTDCGPYLEFNLSKGHKASVTFR